MSLPPPPPALHGATLPIRQTLVAELMRITVASHPSGVYFGHNLGNRFDSPDGSFGVMYAAFDLVTCASETLLRTSRDSAIRNALLSSDIKKRVVTSFKPSTLKLRLVDLTQVNMDIGFDGRISSEDDYRRTQEWARGFYTHPEAPDGLLFMSRQNPMGRNVALFDRPHLVSGLKEASRFKLEKHPDFWKVLSIPGLIVIDDI